VTIEIKVDHHDLDDAPWRRFRWEKAAVEWADAVGPLLRDRLKDEAPVQSGRLRSSIRYQRKTGLDSIHLEFTAHTPYAGYVVHGTRPHIIRPRAARALHWLSTSGDHFSSVVHHPGTRANDFPRRSLDVTREQIIQRFREAIER